MSPKELNQILGRASKKLGYRVHAHLFRHDWATACVLAGDSPPLIQRWAGWRSMDMLTYYVALGEEMVGAIQPKHSQLSTIAVPGRRGRGRPPKAQAADGAF